MASARSERKAAFLRQTSECIARYQPKLEEAFGVELGEVVARELTVWNWTRDQMRFGKEVWLLNREIQRGRPPRWWERLLIELQGLIIPVVLFVPVWFRFWAPELLMKWSGRERCIYIPFHGWDRTYFEENAAKIDQWVVHELAHAAWEALGGDHETGGDGHTWRMWDEGFAHYVADEWFQDFYQSGTVLTEDWSEFRKEGKRKIAALVAEKGDRILAEIPTRWREFEAA